MALFAFSPAQTAGEVDGDRSDAVREAARLSATWTRLGGQHVSLSFGCSCGSGGIAVALEDFEQDIVDFLIAEAERRERSDVLAFLQTHAGWAHGGPDEQRSLRIGRLLPALAKVEPPCPTPEVRAMLVELLGRTLESFERLHGNGFECN